MPHNMFHPYFVITPGEGRVPISLLYDNNREELSFPQIYLGQARNISSSPDPVGDGQQQHLDNEDETTKKKTETSAKHI